MNSSKAILAIDQGTTSTKALVIDQDGKLLGSSLSDRFAIHASYRRPGWVEFAPQQLLESVRLSAEAALRDARLSLIDIAGIGLANQGETIIAFDRANGRPIYPAISWQDRRSEEITERWRKRDLEEPVFSTTGLRLDAYFSAPKMAWILENLPEARDLQRTGRLGLGTSDTWLLWQLTGGKAFVTDVSTASRTMLLDLTTLAWSPSLAKSFGLAVEVLPRTVTNAEPIGITTKAAFGAEIPITGLCVDQQAALFGQGLGTGGAKITYGTGCFLLAIIGADSTRRAPGLLTSVGWKIGNWTSYVFDGGVYSAGSLIDWFCGLGLADNVEHLARLAEDIDPPSPVMLIPAFSGLAAPRWSSHARACWLGMDTSTDRRSLARSTLEAIAFRVKEICDAMSEAGIRLSQVNVDGGLSRCDALMQIQSDVLDVNLVRKNLTEVTALGAGYLAGVGCGLWESIERLPRNTLESITFNPNSNVTRVYATAFDRWKRGCSDVVRMGADGLF